MWWWPACGAGFGGWAPGRAIQLRGRPHLSCWRCGRPSASRSSSTAPIQMPWLVPCTKRAWPPAQTSRAITLNRPGDLVAPAPMRAPGRLGHIEEVEQGPVVSLHLVDRIVVDEVARRVDDWHATSGRVSIFESSREDRSPAEAEAKPRHLNLSPSSCPSPVSLCRQCPIVLRVRLANELANSPIARKPDSGSGDRGFRSFPPSQLHFVESESRCFYAGKRNSAGCRARIRS